LNENPVERGEVCRPERILRDRLIAATVFLGSLAYLCIFRRYTAMDADEGIILQGAERILHGQVLYRDFFSFFTPGSYCLSAAVLKIFGDSLVVARSVLAVNGSILAVLAYLLARRVCSRGISLLTAGLVTFTAVPDRFLVLHNWDSTLWACLAVYAAVRLLESGKVGAVSAVENASKKAKGRWGWAFSVGLFCSLTALFEQSKGAGLVIGLAIGFGIITVAYTRRLFGARDGIAIVAGLALPWVLTVAGFASHQALGPMLCGLLWPMRHYSLVNRVPYGWQNWTPLIRQRLFDSPSHVQNVVAVLVVIPYFIVPALPLVAIGVWGYLASRGLRTLRLTERSAYYILISGSISGLLLSVLGVRADATHVIYLAPLVYQVLAWGLDGNNSRSRLFRAFQPALRTLVIATFGMLGFALLMQNLAGNVTIETRRGRVRVAQTDTVIPYLQAHVPEGSRILVYPYLPLYYYLSGTFSPNAYEFIQPGMHTAEDSGEVIARLVSDRTAVVLYEIDFSEKIPRAWPNTPLEFIAHDSVADFIGSHYRPCELLHSPDGWKFVFMTRTNLACPAK
jgi:4-amino-4-deoxy-L-arabinose transferase-like glycosyltransferase